MNRYDRREKWEKKTKDLHPFYIQPRASILHPITCIHFRSNHKKNTGLKKDDFVKTYLGNILRTKCTNVARRERGVN